MSLSSLPAYDVAADVVAPLSFIVPQDEKPYFKSAALTGGETEAFFQTEEHSVTIQDMRPVADELSLDREGFELHRFQTTVDDLYDDEAVEQLYDREITSLLQDLTGADRVVIFDHTRRIDGPSDTLGQRRSRGVASRVHVDYTTKSGPVRAGDAIGRDEVSRILQQGGHIVQVNVWQPIAGPVQRAPLALADARSIRPRELIATDQLFPDRVGEIYQLAHAPGQRWYWAPDMERDEVLLIKGWDSRDDGRACFTPHGAFQIPFQDPDAPARESIEVRTYLVFEG